MLKQVGVTEDGRPVVAGLFRLYETHGLPVSVIFEGVDLNGSVPSWIDFYEEARQAGIKSSRIISMLQSDIADVFGGPFRDVVIERLERYIELTEGGQP